MIQLPQSPFWAKRKKQPPVSQPNNSSRSHEYLTLGEVERMTIAALVHAFGEGAALRCLVYFVSERDADDRQPEKKPLSLAF